MKTSFKCLLRWGLLFIFGVIFSGKSFGQALVFGSTPSFSALNLKNKKPLDAVLLEVRYQFTWTYSMNLFHMQNREQCLWDATIFTHAMKLSIRMILWQHH